MIDLQPFCPKWAYAEWMEKPFSRAGYTWATDGKLLVRVPLREDVPEHPMSAACERVWPQVWPEAWRQPLLRKLPGAEHVSCDVCDGRGYKHDCPRCTCTCRECNGDGQLEVMKAVMAGARAVSAANARLIIGLDWVEISPTVTGDHLLCFRFEGGEGIVSLLSLTHKLDVVGEI
jgi:hypothetical protein